MHSVMVPSVNAHTQQQTAKYLFSEQTETPITCYRLLFCSHTIQYFAKHSLVWF